MSSKFEKDVLDRFDKTDARMDTFEQDMKVLKQDMSNMKKDISFMKEDMSFMQNNIDNINTTLISIQKSMETMNRSIILIEQKVTTEIPTLFDGYSMHQEKQEQQQENIDSLNVKVEEHDVRISSLEQAIV